MSFEKGQCPQCDNVSIVYVAIDGEKSPCGVCRRKATLKRGGKGLRSRRGERIMNVVAFIEANEAQPQFEAHQESPQRSADEYREMSETPARVDPRTQERPLAPPGRRVG